MVMKSWSEHNLPEHVWLEILSRLPTKSILQFRSISRSWKSMIDDPYFTHLHLDRFNNGAEPRLFFTTGWSYECVVKKKKNLNTISRLGYLFNDLKLEPPNILSTIPDRNEGFENLRQWFILSSIDGLFLLKLKERSDLMLWNPSIRKTLILPSSSAIPPKSTFVNFGLGVDPSIGDYKCVRFICVPQIGFTTTAIYTLGTNSWKETEFRGDARQGIILPTRNKITPLDGSLYAIARYQYRDANPMKLFWFDLRSEVLASVNLPIVDNNIIYDQALTVSDGGCSLALINLTYPEGTIWILERSRDDSNKRRWIRGNNFALLPKPRTDFLYIRFLCMANNGEMLWKYGNSVFWYNLETHQKTRMLEKNHKNLHKGNVVPYVESLLLLHH